ncbi:Atxe2 family lasso peptide isopeptidase [Caulobacter sp.]|uniref:Atxe2 family lasso peptide isopeptidase n=1 Tax=Caulobacter sp. TaxID=78 RepID=UPI0031CE277E
MVTRRVAGAVLAVALGSSAAADPTLEDLIGVPNVSSPAISPDGRWVAFRRDEALVAANRHETSWWVVPVDGSRPAKLIADGGEALFNDAGVLPSAPPTWSAHSDGIFFTALTADGVQVVRAGLDGATGSVTSSSSDVVAFAVDPDGTIVYAAGPTRAEIIAAEARNHDDGVLIDAAVDPAQNLFGAIRINGRLAAQRLAGRWFSRRGLLGDRDLAFWRSSPRGAATAISAETAQAQGLVLDAARKPVFGRPPLVARSATGDQARPGAGADVIIVTDPHGLTTACRSSVCGADKFTQLAWRPNQRELVIVAKTGSGGRALRTWRVGADKARTLFETDGLLHGGGLTGSPCAIGDRLAVCVLASAITPPRLVSIDLDSGHRRDLTHVEADPGVVHHRLQWTDGEGHAFVGEFLEPPGPPRQRPLFITYYSCDGYLRGGVGDEWPMSAFVRSGISALCISAPTEKPGEQDGNLKANETAMSGITAAIDLLDARGRVETGRVGVGGVSFGADVAMWAAMRLPQVGAVSIGSLQLEPTYWWFNTVKGRDAADLIHQAWGLGSPDATPDRWKLLSPALNVEKIKSPVLMQLPEQEFRSTMELFTRLSQGSVPAELFAFPTEPHILTEPRHRLAAYERNLDWFRFWLQGWEDPSAAKIEQYQRWRSARSVWKGGKVSPSDSKP